MGFNGSVGVRGAAEGAGFSGIVGLLSAGGFGGGAMELSGFGGSEEVGLDGGTKGAAPGACGGVKPDGGGGGADGDTWVAKFGERGIGTDMLVGAGGGAKGPGFAPSEGSFVVSFLGSGLPGTLIRTVSRLFVCCSFFGGSVIRIVSLLVMSSDAVSEGAGGSCSSAIK